MNRYRNLDVELAAHGRDGDTESLQSRVLESPVGGQREADATRVDFPRQLRKRMRGLERRELSLEDLILLGEELAGLLLPPAGRELFRRSLSRLGEDEGLRIRIRADTSTIAEIPWEYAYVGRADTPPDRKGPEGFLGLDARISLVRYEVLDEPTTPIPQPSRTSMRLVALLSDVRDPAYPQLDLAREELNLRTALDNVDGIDARFLRPGTLEQLEEVLAEGAQVFHFGGHGELLEAMGEQPGTIEGRGRLILSGDDGRPAPFDAGHLAQELRGRGVRLAVLSACEAARRDPVTPWSGVAPSLVHQGVPAVVGMQYTVRDGNAIAFSRRFYRAIADGQSIDTAVSDGRRGVSNRGGGQERDWGVPVLYLQTDRSVLFPPPLAPLRLNLALAITALGLGCIWFYLHLYPLFADGASRILANIGLGGGALAGVWWLAKIVWSYASRSVGHREQAPRLDRMLRQKSARVVLVPLVVFALVLLATTHSVYLTHDVENPDVVEVAVTSAGGSTYGLLPALTTSKTDGRVLAGGPVLFRPFPRELVLQLRKPVGWSFTDGHATIRPRPWRPVHLTVSRHLTELELRAVRLAAHASLVPLLPGRSDEPAGQAFRLRATVNGTSYTLPGLRRGVVYLGGPREVIHARVRSEGVDARREALKTCLFPPGQAEEQMMRIWGPEDETRRQFLETPILQADQNVLIEVIKVGDDGTEHVVSEKTVSPEQLSSESIKTFCLFKKVGTP